MVYPTFLKSVAGGEFADIGSQAGDALARADQVDIYGSHLSFVWASMTTGQVGAHHGSVAAATADARVAGLK